MLVAKAQYHSHNSTCTTLRYFTSYYSRSSPSDCFSVHFVVLFVVVSASSTGVYYLSWIILIFWYTGWSKTGLFLKSC